MTIGIRGTFPRLAAAGVKAAACAGDQGMFWEMHHQLFDNQQALALSQLPDHAKEIGLDVAAFQKCLSSGSQGGDIRKDVRLAQSLGIKGTPAYLIGRRLPGGDKVQILEILRAMPYEEIAGKLETHLAAKPGN
jgi:protein-disulfide isomerase